MTTLGTPLTDTATRLLLLGSGELGKEEVAELLATLGTTLNDEVLRPYLAPRPRPLCVCARGHERAAKCRYAACLLGCVTSCCVVLCTSCQRSRSLT